MRLFVGLRELLSVFGDYIVVMGLYRVGLGICRVYSVM